jgi:signal transduction histidine kinase
MDYSMNRLLDPNFVSAGESNSKLEILIVDDVRDNLLALDAVLQRDDVIIHQALSGTQGLELMMKHDFCLAILDVNMPFMSGFELAELMRGSKKTKNIPIIFVTATAKEQNFSFKGYESGAVDFLLKPLDTHAVKSKVNIFIEMYRQKNELRTQLAKIEELATALNKSKIEAESANASKTQFLAHMSHEIRTPIGAVLGFAELMKNPNNTLEENQKYMVVVERNSNQLLRLIDDILDLSKVEAGKITIESIEFSFGEMLADFLSVMRLRAEEKGIEFRFKTSTKIPNIICSDPVRLRQILTNIVGNAIKFTDVGYVELNIEYVNSFLRFIITDTGAGISKAQATKLFQPFMQADTSTTRKFGGSGLGLVLSRHLVGLLDGKLKIMESAEGIGSKFLIEVFSTQVSGAKLVGTKELVQIKSSIKEPKITKQILKGLNVLLVEDSLDNQALITIYLNKVGAQVTSVSDGAQGVELAMKKNFDVLLMDIQMPVLDGHEATKKLRRSKYTKPIIALTAHAMKEEQAKCIESGFDEFLTKPIQKDLLIEILARHVP